MLAREDVQRQIAVVAVVAVEKTRLLLAVQRRVRGVQVQHDFLRRLGLGFQKNIHQQRVQGLRRVADLVIALRVGLSRRREFQPVQRALTRQGLCEFPLASKQGQQWIVAQFFVIVHILVAQSQSVDALRQ